MKKRRKLSLRPRHTLLLLAILCIVLIILSAVNPSANNLLRGGVNTILMPFQKVFNAVGGGTANNVDNLLQLNKVMSENEDLKEQVAELTEENTRYQLQLEELKNYQELLELEDEYPDYDCVGAHIIGKNSDNWYKTVQVDKGSLNGIEVDMNVIADGGLVGIVTSVTPATATISTIINDNRNVGAMGLNSKDPCIVSGDLSLYEEGHLSLSKISKDDDISSGDKIVTSNTSDLYLPGILIGYAEDVQLDSNNLTKSGYVVPVVDFSHLDTVLIITTQKGEVTASTAGSSENAGSDAETETESASETETAAEQE